MSKFIFQNYKRVAEVWMDEYKHYLYKKHADLYDNVSAGNLTIPLAIRQSLKCKSFEWFIREIAFDLIKDYPPDETFENAWGAVQSQSELRLCVRTKSGEASQQLELSQCDQNLTQPSNPNQFFEFTWRSEIRVHADTLCWDVSTTGNNTPVILYRCHHGRGNQLWHLDLVSILSLRRVHRNDCIN